MSPPHNATLPRLLYGGVTRTCEQLLSLKYKKNYIGSNLLVQGRGLHESLRLDNFSVRVFRRIDI